MVSDYKLLTSANLNSLWTLAEQYQQELDLYW